MPITIHTTFQDDTLTHHNLSDVFQYLNTKEWNSEAIMEVVRDYYVAAIRKGQHTAVTLPIDGMDSLAINIEYNTLTH